MSQTYNTNNQSTMIEPSFDLDDSLNNSFGSPDTPEFTFTQAACNAILDVSLTKECTSIIQEPFTLESGPLLKGSEALLSLSMANVPDGTQTTQAMKNDSIFEEIDETGNEPIRKKSFIFLNSGHFAERQPKIITRIASKTSKSNQQQLKTQEKPQLCVDPEESSLSSPLDGLEPKPKRTMSFIFTNQVKIESTSLLVDRKKQLQPLLETLALPDKAQAAIQGPALLSQEPSREVEDSHLEKQPTIIQQNKPNLDEVDIDVAESLIQKQVSHMNAIKKEPILAASDISLVSEEKENDPDLRVQQQPQLGAIPEENSAKSIDQGETNENVINVNESTYIQSSISERQEQIVEHTSTSFIVEKLSPHIIAQKSLFWTISVVNEQESTKRHRTKPCQFWAGEGVRYLKNNLIIKRYRRSIEEVFLHLKDHSDIESANTFNASDSVINGEITMKPKSKLKVNQTGERTILTLSKKLISISFHENKLKITNGLGNSRIILKQEQVLSISNCLNEPCKVLIKVYSKN